MKSKLQKGTRIYYGGDMANMEDFGTITAAYTNTWGSFVDVAFDEGEDNRGLPVALFSPEYLGHGGTRFVTLEAYNTFRRGIAQKAGWPYQDVK